MHYPEEDMRGVGLLHWLSLTASVTLAARWDSMASH